MELWSTGFDLLGEAAIDINPERQGVLYPRRLPTPESSCPIGGLPTFSTRRAAARVIPLRMTIRRVGTATRLAGDEHPHMAHSAFTPPARRPAVGSSPATFLTQDTVRRLPNPRCGCGGFLSIVRQVQLGCCQTPNSSKGNKWNDGCGRVDRVRIYFGLAFMVRTVLHPQEGTA